MKYPQWIIDELKPKNLALKEIKAKVNQMAVNTVCESALCPNRGQCYLNNTMTFMILGDVCTRNCRFCAVPKGLPQEVDPQEIEKILNVVQNLKLNYVVVTSVTRDDLPDEGAGQYVALIKALRKYNPQIKIETLTPDYRGNLQNLSLVVQARPDVFNHNLETVRRLYPKLRALASYEHSLSVLKLAKQAGLITKSGIMVGVGETTAEVFELLDDLKKISVDIVTIGQYIQPSKSHYDVHRFVKPSEFKSYQDYGKKIGLQYVFSGPLVRSSYMAAEVLDRIIHR